jgi:hypothetical protein
MDPSTQLETETHCTDFCGHGSGRWMAPAFLECADPAPTSPSLLNLALAFASPGSEWLLPPGQLAVLCDPWEQRIRPRKAQ